MGELDEPAVEGIRLPNKLEIVRNVSGDEVIADPERERDLRWRSSEDREESVSLPVESL
jgi:hypothetical protein